jgi:hypothetical protein
MLITGLAAFALTIMIAAAIQHTRCIPSSRRDRLRAAGAYPNGVGM